MRRTRKRSKMSKRNELTSAQKKGLNIQRSMGMIAGAGSGKTLVLTERFIKIMDKFFHAGKSADEALRAIVGITFTRKAASEMASRIAKRCEELATSDSEGADFWHEAAMRMAETRVGTIHSFCGQIIKTFPAIISWPIF